eukprot:scaffold2113_cov146-Skeletonema_menzelii.AAC.6
MRSCAQQHWIAVHMWLRTQQVACRLGRRIMNGDFMVDLPSFSLTRCEHVRKEEGMQLFLMTISFEAVATLIPVEFACAEDISFSSIRANLIDC